MSKLKNSKYKNTGILFELLVRQIASDILSHDKSYNCTIDAFPVKSFIRVYEDEFFCKKFSSFDLLWCW